MSDTLAALTTRTRSRYAFDAALFVSMIVLGVTGVIVVYGATRENLIINGYNPHYFLERQGVFVVMGVVAMWIVSRIDYRRLEVVATPFYVISLFALAGVFLLGQSALGAQRWYSLGSAIQVQPSEFTVLILVLAIATFCARRTEGLKMYDVVRLLVMAVVPLLLIVLQPDLGTSTIIVLIVASMMILAGVPPRFMALLVVVGSIGLTVAIFLDFVKRYQIDRFIAFSGKASKNVDVQAVITVVANAKSAIGSGGVHGVGLFHGLQTNLGFVPEQQTDFIFTVIGEQLGFIGASLIILLLGFIAFRMFMVGRNAKDMMGRLLCIGVFIFFAFSCFENIGMNMGIMPVTGIPLPLLSYGGSSVMVFFVAAGVVLSVSRRTGN